MGTESSSTLCAWIHTRTHTRVFYEHKPARLNIHTYECVEANRGETERKREIFWAFSTDRAEERIKCCRTSANMASCLLALWSDRSSVGTTNLCVHTHTHKNVCLCAWFDVCEGWHRRSRVFLPRGDCHLCVVTIIKHIPLTFFTRYRSNPRKFIDISPLLLHYQLRLT